MIDFVIGTAALVPSLYWAAVVATSVKNITDDNK